MAGYIIPIVSKRLIDFTTLNGGSVQDVVLADRIDLLHWREASLVIRVHEQAIAVGGAISVMAIAQSWTRDEPETAFLGREFPATSIDSSTSAGLLITRALAMRGGGCMSAMMQLVARVSGAGLSPLRALITVELSVKDA